MNQSSKIQASRACYIYFSFNFIIDSPSKWKCKWKTSMENNLCRPFQSFQTFADVDRISKFFESFCNFWIIFNFFLGIYKLFISNFLEIFVSCVCVLVTKQVYRQALIAQMERIIGLCCLLFGRSIQMYNKNFLLFKILSI